MAVDLLVFGPHPDDAEIGLGGTMARHAARGHAVAICDLTRGELGSNGTPEDRAREAGEAARVLGLAWRENLGWPDGGITGSPEMIRSAVALVRRHRPEAVAIPHWDDRHPDHVDASRVLTRAVFQAGLRRVDPGDAPWSTPWICYYFINGSAPTSFVVDVSEHYAVKQRALDCYQSQFAPADADAAPTRLTAPSFRRLIESRDAQFGAQAGVAFAEGLVVREPVVRSSLFRNDR